MKLLNKIYLFSKLSIKHVKSCLVDRLFEDKENIQRKEVYV